MIRPSSDQYYFQLEPLLLTIIKPTTVKSVENAKSTFRLKVLKGFQTCDEIKKPLEVPLKDGKLTFDKIYLTFYLPTYNPDRNIEFKLTLLRTDDGMKEVEIGKITIKSGDFIARFRKEKTRVFKETGSIGNEY